MGKDNIVQLFTKETGNYEDLLSKLDPSTRDLVTENADELLRVILVNHTPIGFLKIIGLRPGSKIALLRSLILPIDELQVSIEHVKEGLLDFLNLCFVNYKDVNIIVTNVHPKYERMLKAFLEIGFSKLPRSKCLRSDGVVYHSLECRRIKR